MSNVYDENHKLINTPGHGTTNGQGVSRYKNADMTEIDWFDTHPRPEAKVAPAPVAPAASKPAAPAAPKPVPAPRTLSAPPITVKSVEAGLPSAVDLDVVAAEEKAKDATSGSNSDVPQV